MPWLPTSASEEIDRIEFTFWFTTVICIGVFSVVASAILYSILKFRVPPRTRPTGRLSTATPASRSLDGGSGGPRHGDLDRERVVLAKNDDPGPNPLRIAVTAQQFAWQFEYPGDEKSRPGGSCSR